MANQYKTMVVFNGTASQNGNLNKLTLDTSSQNIQLLVNNRVGSLAVNFIWTQCFNNNNLVYMVKHSYSSSTISAQRDNVLNAIKDILRGLGFSVTDAVLFAYQGSEQYL